MTDPDELTQQTWAFEVYQGSLTSDFKVTRTGRERWARADLDGRAQEIFTDIYETEMPGGVRFVDEDGETIADFTAEATLQLG